MPKRADRSPDARSPWRILRSRRARLTALGAAAVVLGAGWLLHRQGVFAGSTVEFYVVLGRQVRFEHEPNRIGIVLRNRAAAAALRPLLTDGAILEPKLPGSLRRIAVAGSVGRQYLARVARKLLERTELVKHAGVLVTPLGSKKPLLLTHELVVRFVPAATDAQIAEILGRHEVDEVERSATIDRTRVLATRPGSDRDTLEVCQLFAAEPLVVWAEPNFVQEVENLSQVPNDPLFPRQWHLQNTGQGLGTPDADIDAPQAWDLTMGSPEVVIAVLEDGFDASHPDLVQNLWSDPEHPEDHGWDFYDGDATLLGDPDDPGGTAHGTSVAGCAAARGDNGLGVSGSCPDCNLMLLRRPKTFFGDGEAIHYAWTHGADILSNSWTYPEGNPIPQPVRDALAEAAEKGRDGKGCVILFAVQNLDIEIDELDPPAIVTLPEVLGVGAVANTDQRTRQCGVGPSLDILGPTRLYQAPYGTAGTLNVATTDWQGTAEGYNADPALRPDPNDESSNDVPCGDLEEVGDASNYTVCFGGTSAATPIVAGVVGLVLSADPDLTRVEVEHLLQDTADRTEDSAAVYSPVNGRSTAESHGNGRVNAFEAVRVVAPRAMGGRGGVDVFVRDHRLDWGNTEQPSSLLFEPIHRGVIGPWQSPDIRVDAPPYADSVPSAASFDAFADEDPAAGQKNRVYVRVRNRGPKPAADVAVRLLLAPGGSALPPLASDFWASFPAEPSDPSAWTSAGVARIPHVAASGASLAGTSEDSAAVAVFELTIEPRDEPDAGILGLLVVVDCAADPVSSTSRASCIPGAIVPWDNNVACRNLVFSGAEHLADGPTVVSFPVRNPFEDPIQIVLELLMPPESLVRIESDAPLGLPVEVPAPDPDAMPPPGESVRRQFLGNPFRVEGGFELPVRWTCLNPGADGSLEVRAWRQDDGSQTLLGGVVFGPAIKP